MTAVRHSPKFVLNKILSKVVVNLKKENDPRIDSEIEKINKLIQSEDISEKREYITNRIKDAEPKDLNRTEGKLRASLKKVKVSKEEVEKAEEEAKKENLLTEATASEVSKGLSAITGAAAVVISTGLAMAFVGASIATGGAGTGALVLTGVPLAVLISVIAGLVATSVVLYGVSRNDDY